MVRVTYDGLKLKYYWGLTRDHPINYNLFTYHYADVFAWTVFANYIQLCVTEHNGLFSRSKGGL